MRMKSLGEMFFGVALMVAPVMAKAQVGAGRVDPDQLSKFGAPDTTGPQAAKDRLFLHEALAGGLAEAMLGQLAEQKGNTEDVKAFGKRMAEDHTALDEQLTPIAAQLGTDAPKKPGKQDEKDYAKLNGLTGAAFDQEYLAYMVKAHEKDLSAYQNELAVTNNAALKDAVNKGQAMIQQHLAIARKLAASGA